MKDPSYFKLHCVTILLLLLTASTQTLAQSALDGFDPNVNGAIYALVVQPDGKILMGGDFTVVSGVGRPRIARLNPDRTLDAAFNPDANNTVRSIAIQADGKILVGGAFTFIGGQFRNRIARLDGTTGLSDLWNPNVTQLTGIVYSLLVQPDGKIFASGSFDKIAVQADGKILAGGEFLAIGGEDRFRIARLDATTGSADSFDPNANNRVQSIAIQSDGKVLAGGMFSGIGGETRNYIARLDAATGAADSWNPIASNSVHSIVAQSDGKVLAGGLFTNSGGQPRNYFARLDETDGLADSFNPNPDAAVYSIAIQSDGKILAGGFFSSISTQTQNCFARLVNDTAVLQNLAVSQTTIVWTRDRSAPQFTRAAFELSTDNGATYTSLGNGTPSLADLQACGKADRLAPMASAYTRTGSSLPARQNILIRARGFYRSGYQNGSETTKELVKNGYFFAPSAAAVGVGGRVTTPQGVGVVNAIVTLADKTGQSRVARTSAFGYYRFDDIPAGEAYLLSVLSKRYTFASQMVTVNEEITDLNFVADP